MVLALALCLGVSAGCHTPREPAAGETLAECAVCKHEGDLPCVRVVVTPDTPRCEHGGQVHYFCSDECQREFERHPERYLPVNSR
jgi:hypothetical protein